MIISCKIVNNRPICGKCYSDNLSNIRDYKEIRYKDRFAVMFIKKCYDCNEDIAYLVTEIPLYGDNTREEITQDINSLEEYKED